MSPEETEKLDASKLHTEANQLRNQQFVLGTLAVGAVGYSSWLIPALSRGSNDGSAHAIATISLLVLLSVLFAWSTALRRLIGTISRYLEVRGWSRWEREMRQFTYARGTGHWSQTRGVMVVYLVLGSILTVNYFLLCLAGNATLSARWGWVVFLSGVVYVVFVYGMAGTCRRHDDDAERHWRGMLDLGRSAGSTEQPRPGEKE